MQLKIEKGSFTNHSLEDIASALKKGLSENFKNVEVEVVDCPNLREWDCPSEGISGNQKSLMLVVNHTCMILILLVLNLITKKFLK